MEKVVSGQTLKMPQPHWQSEIWWAAGFFSSALSPASWLTTSSSWGSSWRRCLRPWEGKMCAILCSEQLYLWSVVDRSSISRVCALAVCGRQRHPERPAGEAQQCHGWSQQSLCCQVTTRFILSRGRTHTGPGFYCACSSFSLKLPASHRREREADGRHLGSGEGNLKRGKRQQRSPGCWQCSAANHGVPG